MDDAAELNKCNEVFIEACRLGSWPMLLPLLSDSFAYLDGLTGEPWDMDRYIKDLEENPAPTLSIDQVVVRVMGDVGLVSARTSSRPGRHNRYVDVYSREVDGAWRCIHACVWPLS
jgi:hypothetical protein